MNDVGAVIWCPECEKDLFELHRKPADNPGVFTNELKPLTEHTDHLKCACGASLVRKDA